MPKETAEQGCLAGTRTGAEILQQFPELAKIWAKKCPESRITIPLSRWEKTLSAIYRRLPILWGVG
ncbi:MAG: hypothetical protein PHU73_00010 [Patescibacteria group bacterium]|nr:hypothetical protein [Patescibacteria group bacterium]